MAEQLASGAPNQHEAQKHSGRVVYCNMDSVVKQAEFILEVAHFDEYIRALPSNSFQKANISSDFNANGITGKISLRESEPLWMKLSGWSEPGYCSIPEVDYTVSLNMDEDKVGFSVFEISLKAFLCQDQNQIEVLSDQRAVRGEKPLKVSKCLGMTHENFEHPRPYVPSTVTASTLRIVLNARVAVSKPLKQHPVAITCDVDGERDPPFLKALQEGCDSDVKLVCDETTFPVHGIILKNVSRVFRRMLEAPMKEAMTKSIKIEDLSLDSVQRMVDYIYHGRFNLGSDAQVVQLLYAADKYEIERLKTACLEHMVTSMSDENITPFLDNSVRVNAGAEVIKQMLNYCMDRMGELRKREDFQAFALENSKLFLENLLARE